MHDAYTWVIERLRIETGSWIQKQVQTDIYYNLTAVHCIRNELGFHLEVSEVVLFKLKVQ